MRIISGLYKGKKIHQPLDSKTRPLKDLTKESVFNIIKHSKKLSKDISKSEVLDLFSGTGSFGIECLSREAKYVTFVENYKGILPILKKNLLNLKSLKNYSIVEENAFNYFDVYNFKKTFDIIFLDPPYKENNLANLISSIIENKILNYDGIIILHRHKKHTDTFPSSFKIVEEKKYGISKIIFGSYS